MPRELKSQPHTYDYDAIACVCGCSLAYRPARSALPWQCVQCDREVSRDRPPKPALPPAVQAFADAWDHARARSLTGDSSVAIPIALIEAVDTARKELP